MVIFPLYYARWRFSFAKRWIDSLDEHSNIFSVSFCIFVLLFAIYNSLKTNFEIVKVQTNNMWNYKKTIIFLFEFWDIYIFNCIWIARVFEKEKSFPSISIYFICFSSVFFDIFFDSFEFKIIEILLISNSLILSTVWAKLNWFSHLTYIKQFFSLFFASWCKTSIYFLQ